ncbi:MAG TPA: methionine--tRNA ligase [Gaiellales bacterium]|nr:methionine--tRNA ligase [Gaiellales bacterium]
MPFSVTTPIYYVNSDPHLGHAYTTVAADVLARHRRRCGDEVFFLTGTDEHGGNVARAAAAAGLPPKEFCDRVSARFRELVARLGASNDFFIRTTDPEHEHRVQQFVTLLRERGELYEDTYAGWYCSACEQFYAEADLVQPGNVCPQHRRPAEWVEERNWFFPLSRWRDRLLELYRQPDFVAPRARYNEARTLIESGLSDFSVSRASVSWGVPLPWDPSQTIYVWVDALLNYRTALEYGLGRDVSSTFWPISLHLMAKDILRLHAISWPAMLMAAGYAPPQRLFVHGYFTSGGQKMSKTLGNVIDPLEVIEATGGPDPLRYYLLREVHWGQDGDVTREGLDRRYEGELANDLGNLVSRATAMVVRYREGVVPAGESALTPVHERVAELLQQLDLTAALQEIWQLVRAANRFVEERAPWQLAKSDDPSDAARLDETLYTLVDAVRSLAVMLWPFLPGSAERMLDAVGDPGATGWERAGLGLLAAGTTVTQPPPLFPRLPA